MKRLAWFCFIYGCVGTIGALVWFLLSVFAGFVPSLSLWAVQGIVIPTLAVWILTMRMRSFFSPIQPVLIVTRRRVRFARGLLGLAAANLLFWVAFGRPMGELAIYQLLNGIVLAVMLYIAVNWGLSPENIFRGTKLEFLLGRAWEDRPLARYSRWHALHEEQLREFARLSEIVGRRVAWKKVYGRPKDSQRRQDSSSTRES
jgi:hypothetical protein